MKDLSGTVYFGFEYQGYAAVAGAYRHSDGLSPDGGYVLIPKPVLGKIKIFTRELPWRSVTGAEVDGGVDIRTWKRFRSKATITADRPPIPAPEGGGLAPFGDLLIRTFSWPDGKVLREMKYKDVFVDRGIEEVTRDLASILKHEEGLVKVPLTDARRYIAEHGCFIGRINCRRKTAGWDKETVNDDGSPHPTTEIIEYLFDLLPTSPLIRSDSELYELTDLDPYVGLEGRGEPPGQHLMKVLERFALKAQKQPDGRYAVSRKFSTRYKRFEVAEDVNDPRNAKLDLHYERLTSTPTDRPGSVIGLGPRRIQRVTVPYVAVLQDIDGRWYRIEALCARYFYSFESFNRQVFADPKKSFADLDLHRSNEDGLADRLKVIFRAGYRFYLPAFLFKDPDAGLDLEDPDFDLVPMLPMVDAPWYLSELSPKQRKAAPTDDGEKGDLDKFQLIPPVARGCRVKSGWFDNFDQIRAKFNMQLARAREDQAFWEELKRQYLVQAQKAGQDLVRSQTVALETQNVEELQDEFGLRIFGEGALDIGGDVKKALDNLGLVMSDKERIEANSQSLTARELLLIYTKMAKAKDEKIAEAKKLVERWKLDFEDFEKAYEEKHAIKCNYNTPQEVLTGCSFNAKTGLLTSSVRLCRVDAPFYFDGDEANVGGDGGVTVTYGVELKGSLMSAFTNYHFFADDGGDQNVIPEIKFAGCHRSGPLKGKAVPIESREYILENGNPVNYNACFSEARSKASGQLAQPREVPGWVMELRGLHPCVLDGGIQSVQHEWDGERAFTHVAVNAPRAEMPLGPPFRGKPPSDRADRGEEEQRGGESWVGA